MLTPSDELLAIETRRALLRLRERAWMIATGLVCGVLLGAATLVLVVRGGPRVGAHLGLLSVYLPGYSVTVLGSVVGFVYAFFIGGALGWLAGRLYNLFAHPR
jgi:hypothetical protein